MYSLKSILGIVFLVISISAFSQSQEKTNINLDIDIVKVYTQVVNEGYGTPQIYLELANACYFKSQYEDSKKWFEKLFEEEKITDKTLLYRYKQSLKALGLFSEKNTYLVVSGAN